MTAELLVLGGTTSVGDGILDYYASSHSFHGSMYSNGSLIATTDQIPSLSDVQNQINLLPVQIDNTNMIFDLYATLSGAVFTGAVTTSGLSRSWGLQA